MALQTICRKAMTLDPSCAIAGLLEEHNRYPASVAIYPLDIWLWGEVGFQSDIV